MPLKTTTFADLLAHLAELGLGRGDDVLVQSRLVSFGLIDGGAETAYRALRETVGPEATIVVPAYRLEASPEEVFDRDRSPSLAVGVLAEYVRTLPGAVRSNCQMHSHAAIGPKADLLNRVSGDVSLGPGSDFDVMEQAGFHLLLLGCDFTIATFVIHVEAMHGAIPYRDWLRLPRPRAGQPDAICRYYGRIRSDSEEDLTLVAARMEKAGTLRQARCAYGRSFLMAMHDVQASTKELLMASPEALLTRVSP